MASVTIVTQILAIIALASCGFILVFSLTKYKRIKMYGLQKWIVVVYIGHVLCVSAYLCGFLATNATTIQLFIWTLLFASYLMNYKTRFYTMFRGSAFASSKKKLLMYTLFIITISSLWPIGYYLQSVIIFIILLIIVFLYDLFSLYT
eukprot:492855_1